MAWRVPLLDAVGRWLVGLSLRALTKPLSHYNLAIPNDLSNLKRYIRKGDVILVEGNERISECIKYLTQSSWSHSALYVGDEPLRRNPQLRAELQDQFGPEAEFLLLEALVETGVMLSPLSKYKEFNIRVCRPYNLTRADLEVVLNEALAHVGHTYDLKNIFDLARYFLPVSLVPRRFRRKALNFGSGEPTRVICSSMIAGCFNRVRFPIMPKLVEPPTVDPPARGLRRLLAGQADYGLWRHTAAALITPRDFDLSPYFEIVKFNIIEELKFDYRRIRWAVEPETAPTPKLEKSA